MIQKLLFLTTLIIFFTACSTNPAINNSYKPHTNNSVTKALYKEFQKWKETPYKYGGNSLNGTDCSGFTQAIYKNVFHTKIPRTTKEQAKIGYRVSKKDVRVGDIVLFKTGRNVRHSGVIIEGDSFIHSGTSTGVTISKLTNRYWKSHFWQIRRVL
jgi:cell wall-associated NlpC family hydrolase